MLQQEREIYLVGLNHRTAGVEVREAFALSGVPMLEHGLLPVVPEHPGAEVCPPGQANAGRTRKVASPAADRQAGEARYGEVAGTAVAEQSCLSGPFGVSPADILSHSENGGIIREALVLSTCNRVEILAVGDKSGLQERIIRYWAEARGKKAEDLRPYVYCYQGEEAVRHLFTVASSLDSMVLGEPQILGQLKNAYKNALELGSTRVILNRLLHRAFSVAKRVRTETGVASSAVSISYAAVELAKRIFGDMSPYKAMLIGAGEMAELAATHLMHAGIKSVWVANRTHERAVELAAQYNGLAVPFENLFNQLHEVDIVISSTGAPEAIIAARDMRAAMRRRRNRPMFFIDIAVPRDVDPDVNGLDNIYLYDIDDLKEVVEENLAQRQEEAVKARQIVAEEARAFMRWQDSLRLQPTIIELVRRTENIAEEEFARTARKLNLDEETRQALRSMLRSIAKKFNHEPITFLKRRYAEEEAGVEYLNVVRRLFDLDHEDIPAEAHAERKRSRG